MSWQALISLAAAAIAFIAVWAVLAKSQTGRRMRAAAEDPEIAAAHGIPVMRLAILAFAVAGALAGLAGVLLAAQHYATPGAGADYILKAYVAATAAGWGRILPYRRRRHRHRAVRDHWCRPGQPCRRRGIAVCRLRRPARIPAPRAWR